MPVSSSSIAKATASLAATVPRMQSRLGGFHIIVVAAFTLLGFYVCFKQMRALTAEVASIKTLIKKGGAIEAGTTQTAPPNNAKERVPETIPFQGQQGVSATTLAPPTSSTAVPNMLHVPSMVSNNNIAYDDDDYGFEEIDAQEIKDAGLRDMLKDLVSSSSCNVHTNGVTVVIGTDTTLYGQENHVGVVEDITDTNNEFVEEESGIPVQDLGNKEDATENRIDNIETLSVKDLRSIATERGIPVKQGTKKSDIIALIREADSLEEIG